MKNSLFNDIIPPRKKSIRDIQNSHIKPQRPVKKISEEDFEYNLNGNIKKRNSSRFIIWFVIIIALAVFTFVFSFLFSGAKISITPKQNKTFVDARFTAAIEARSDELPYEIMTIEKTGSKKILAVKKEQIEEKASGKIIIFNDFSSANQRLLINTRFETPNGLIYKINKSVVVPGQKKENGEIIPGSIEVAVYADEAGENFNIGLTDFIIPGFKSFPQFDKFYARSKTPMTGGFAGEKLIADPTDVENAKNEIHSELRTQLLNEAFSQKPDGFYLFEDAVFVEFESEQTEGSGDKVEVKEKAILYGVLFNKNEFAKYIAENTFATFDESLVEISDITALTLTVLNKEQSRPWEDKEFEFTIKGNVNIIWVFDEERLKQDLAGKSKAAFQTIRSGYSSIEEAEIILRPFWKRTFPNKINKIKIERILNK